MNKARLVKRSEVKEQEQPPQQPPSSSISQSVQAVRAWINQHQMQQRTDAREAFALLFGEPQKA